MNTAELKKDIINKITALDEVRIVEEIRKLLDFELDKEVFRLNKSQKLRIEEAQQELQNTEILTEKQADKDIEAWLQEK